MKQFEFIVRPGKSIDVYCNGQYIFHQHWNSALSTRDNQASAETAVKRIVEEMAEQGKLAAQAGKKFAAECANKALKPTSRDAA